MVEIWNIWFSFWDYFQVGVEKYKRSYEKLQKRGYGNSPNSSATRESASLKFISKSFRTVKKCDAFSSVGGLLNTLEMELSII